MKIRNKFLIPMIALLLAALMIGSSVSGAATDTTASVSASETTQHPLTYIPTTIPPTSSLEEEIDKFVSENLGGLAGAEDEVREFGGIMGTILRAFQSIIDKIIALAEKVGEFLGSH